MPKWRGDLQEEGLASGPGSLLRNLLAAPALRFHDFRLLWISGLFNSTGFIGEQVVLGWLVLELTDSPFMVGTALALRMAPFLLLGAVAGAIADIVDRRSLLRSVSLGMAVLSAGAALLIMLDMMTLWLLLAITFVGGCMRAMHQPARQSFVFDIVGPDNLVNGLSYVSLSMRIGGIGGSLLTGFLVGRIGYDAAFGVLALSYVGSALSIQLIRASSRHSAEARTPLVRNLRELGVEFVRNPDFRWMLILSAAVEILGFSHQALLPVIARDVLDVGAEGLGLMMSLRAVGGIAAILALSSMGQVRRQGALYLGAVYVFGVTMLLLAAADTFVIALVVVMAINGMGALSDILSQSLVQTVVPDALRGRAMGSWVLAVGMGPLGSLQIGALASWLTVGAALTIHGAGLLALGVGALFLFPRLRKL